MGENDYLDKVYLILLVMAKPIAANLPLKTILPTVEVGAFFNLKAGHLSMAIFIA